MKKTVVTLCMATCAWAFAGAAAAEPVAGVLERGPVWSALFSASAETGDLIGYGFKNQTPTGKAILARCLPGLLCKIEKPTLRDLADSSAMTFADQPSGWKEITSARNVGMQSAAPAAQTKLKTRHGLLSINEEDNTLLFKGRRVLSGVQGNNSLSLLATYELGRNDVVLVQNNGGTACPALYRFITISASGLAATPEFGSCSDLIYPTSDGKTQITVAMPGFAGASESRATQDKAAMTKTVFRYQNGQVAENGKALR